MTQTTDMMILPRAFLRACRRANTREKVADSTGARLTGNDLLLRSLAIQRLLNRKLLAADEPYVGLLLPPSAGGVLANAALAIGGRVAVNLNYTLTPEVINACIKQCGIRHVISSRKVMERLKIELDAAVLYLEDFARQLTWADKLWSALHAKLPIALLERRLGLTRIRPEQTLTVIFTSGSTGQPKGVVLSQENLAANMASIENLIHLTEKDVALGVLPFFHSAGFTATLWTVLALDPKGVYHHNPLDAKEVGALCQKHGVTVLIATPTFMRMYSRKCEVAELASVNVVYAGAEKLPKELADAFESKYGVRPLETYGATELSPLAAANVAPGRQTPGAGPGAREGSVGRPISGVEIRAVDPESGKTLPAGTAGMLWVRGKNVMQGYLNQPELTAKVMRDGWYVSGDMGLIDADGFVFITGRESRFSKIGGEMVPHIKIEETLQSVLHLDEELRLVVTAVPDAKKGERIVVIHTELPKKPEEICKLLAQAGLPNLWIPSPDSFRQVEKIPVLGTGKLDLRGVRQLAEAQFQ